jgi:hypothetical protein
MNPGHNRRDVLADDAEDGERVLAITYRLAKVFEGGVMRREVRIGQAGSPPGLDGAGGWPCRISNDVSVPFSMAGEARDRLTASSSPNLEKSKVDTTDCLVDPAFGQLSGTANRTQGSTELYPATAARTFRLCLSGSHPCS